MKATFELGGCIIIDITSNGHLESREPSQGFSGAGNPGHVGIQVTSVSLDRTEIKTLVQAFVSPSKARAIASAMLSAATETGKKKL